ncbi:autotransporter-associated beta strand repeat-containing protein [Microbulbifer halophilus]|uniref:Autotransporter-associated beta strand repeat-containing protein n=1 Tax=Microbulbifer halophilus TaxID=453963 RepID=A0ABW5EHD5_9GAMM|nr:autotransporter-associated beta strand repeat-containing protein [Microbulbifer halophilus]MCW8127603.1 autotransporter outer membrane beta-barrel domain-containing protein [Microbulbifer halophilus]
MFRNRSRHAVYVRSTALASASMLAIPTLVPVVTPAWAQQTQDNWIGAVSNVWFDPQNWQDGTVPVAGKNVDIDTDAPNGNGAVVDGAPAIVGQITVGRTGSGALSIRNGGVVESLVGSLSGNVIGANPGSRGTVTVTGPGSLWSMDGALTVNSVLAIEDGGRVSAIGTTSSGMSISDGGIVTVTGLNSDFETNDILEVGVQGAGTLTISAGGVVTSARGVVGDEANSTGTVTVTGPGARWSMNTGLAGEDPPPGALLIGAEGTGSVTVADGGLVSASNGITIAQAAGATGTLNIGAAAGQAAAAAGDLQAPTVAFGAGTGTINFNHTSSDHIFAPAISGTGSVNQLAGTTTLTGNNSYKGATTVSGGRLLIDGDHSGATGLTRVRSGGTLGGEGTIGGDVTVDGGGKLTAFDNDQDGIHKLTLNGNLALQSGATLDYDYGQSPNGAPDALMMEVGGDVDLGGSTLNVANNSGQDLAPGVYGLIHYDGNLSGRFANANLPSSDFSVQTSVAGRVNLVNAAGFQLSFWDGGGTPGNGRIEGGSGVWQASGDRNWTTVDGARNGSFADDSFAIFLGAPGTVTVDNGNGPVKVADMQFAVDGYRIAGDALTLGTDPATILVGDNTVNGAGWTATIDSVLRGDAGLIKEDLGTLVLGGANSYSGGTTINAGTLSVSSDANLGAAGAGLTIDGGTLQTTAGFTSGRGVTLGAGGGTFRTDAPLHLTGVIGGAGALTKTGAGALTLSGTNTYQGGTRVDAGVLVVGGGGATGSIEGDVTVKKGAGLAFDRSNAYRFDGLIEGGGSVQQAGTGTLTFTADNTYSGGTSIESGGTLQLGNGGTSGSAGSGDIENHGALVFNRSNALAIPGTITGGGRVEQAGSGTTTLTGNNSYGGPTTVSAGTLLIDGDQSGATGLTRVQNGGTLGGEGTIGGNVRVDGGGTLTAFDSDGDGIHKLTINGDLGLQSGANLDYTYGQSPSGNHDALMLEVGGNVDLGGSTLNVENNSGQDFDPGVYGLIHYRGSLSGSFGATNLPSGDFSVQTSVSGRVNMVNTAGLEMNFWDGPGNPNDGVIQGGGGVWQGSGGNTNWTDIGGRVNGAFTDGSFAIFQGRPGTVIVDNSQGQVRVAGMQFAVDGYTITGDAIALGTDPATIRVGDGTPNGADDTATIESVLRGSAGLVKADLGTLVLTGNNTYSGGTTIEAGELALGGNSGSIEGDVTVEENGRLVFDRFNAYTFGGVISGGGQVEQRGFDTVTLTADNTYSGGTTISNGRLRVAGTAGTLGTGDVGIAGGGTLVFDRTNTYTYGGEISGAGRVEQAGSGTTILTGDSDYKGGTWIARGTLQLGDGGGTGSITGDIATGQAGRLAFNRSDAYTFGGVISGAGRVEQVGSGTTTLTGNNRYSGTTTVSDGRLLIDGDQSAATGLTRVRDGGTLGGGGTIGGNVRVDGGGRLTAFDSDDDGVHKLTINGDLGLRSGANLDYTYGQSPGGNHDALMMEVGGNVDLGGSTLHVRNHSGRDFDPGIYGLIHYGGSLSGSFANTNLPSGDFSVQTSVPGRVNMVNTAGLEMNFWDGPGNPNDGVIQGGSGVWQGSGGNTNWTDIEGTPNGAFTDGSFAIFQGRPGMVTVDNSQGQVGVAGMQFAVDGYTIIGEAITLESDSATIRVGDGTPNGADDTATIGSVLRGSAGLVKADLGTLVLTGNNTYSGGTTIEAGTLSVSDNRNLGAAGTELRFDGGILRVTGTDYRTTDRPIAWGTFGGGFDIADAANTFTLDQTLAGSGPLDKLGGGTLHLTGDSSGFTGETEILAGTLAVDGSLCGPLTIRAGGTLAGTGTVCDTTSFSGGTIAPAGPGHIGTLTIDGDYTSNGGNLAIDAALGDDSSPSDLLHITGDTLMGSGATRIFVTNLGGDGGETSGDGIRIVQVDGTSSADLFELGAPAIGGEYSYDLFFEPGDGDWFLRSVGLAPTVPTYEAYAATLLDLMALPTLRQRVGNRYYAFAGGGADLPTAEEPATESMGHSGGRVLRTRIEATHGHFEGASSLGTEYDSTRTLVQVGADGQLADKASGIVIGGLTAHYAHAESDIESETGNGTASTDTVGVGASLTWYGDDGLYADGQATLAYLMSDLSATGIGALVDDNSGWGYGLGIEAGKRIAIGGNWSVTPQAQLSYTGVDFDDFTDPFDADIALESGDSLNGRLGVAFDTAGYGAGSGGHVYTIANLTYEFLDGTAVDVDDTVLDFEPHDFGGELGIGGTYEWGGGKYTVHGEALGQTSFEGSYGFKGIVGFSMRF